MRVAAQIIGGRSLRCRIRIALLGFGCKSYRRPLQLSGAEWGVVRRACSLVPNGGFGFGSNWCLGVRSYTVLYGSVLNSVRGLGGEPHGCSRELAISALLELSPTTHNVVSYLDFSYGILSVNHVRWQRGGVRHTSCFRDLSVEI